MADPILAIYGPRKLRGPKGGDRCDGRAIHLRRQAQQDLAQETLAGLRCQDPRRVVRLRLLQEVSFGRIFALQFKHHPDLAEEGRARMKGALALLHRSYWMRIMR
jgi:hypothetical protein